ncbi:MAG: FAD-dependent thymidylate synthase [Candidatus Omnitrophica bacterium]|nr:FAD-dependent thymidylate synthase [Candidatus Omnitrophota bacterium]
MPEAKLNIKLLDKTDNALSIIYSACRQCYSAEFSGNIFENSRREKNTEKISSFVRKVIESGHESPLEHVKFTFAVEGVSRALTHQLVRHRLASYSQQSQRYVKESHFDFIIPPSLRNDRELNSRFLGIMELIQEGYNDLLGLLKTKGIQGEKANQDARFVLPQAAETKIVLTMNCRSLKNFFYHRCCARAQWEICALANAMLDICKKELPEVFGNAGAKCENLGFCPEGQKFTCGKYPPSAGSRREARG